MENSDFLDMIFDGYRKYFENIIQFQTLSDKIKITLMVSINDLNYRSSSSSFSFNIPSFPLLGSDVMSHLHCCLSSAISSIMYKQSASCLLPIPYSRTILVPTGLLPSTTSSIEPLSIQFSSLQYVLQWANHLNHFFLICVQGSPPHIFIRPTVFIISSLPSYCWHVSSTFYDHDKLAVLPVFQLVPQHTALQASHNHSKPFL